MECTTFFHHIFTKWPLAAILVFRFSPKSIGFFHSGSSMAVSNMNFIRALVSQYVKHKPWRAADAAAAAAAVAAAAASRPKP